VIVLDEQLAFNLGYLFSKQIQMKTLVKIFLFIVFSLLMLFYCSCVPNKYHKKKCYRYFVYSGYDSINQCPILKPVKHKNIKENKNLIWYKLDKCK
jgi:hypothetical protein